MVFEVSEGSWQPFELDLSNCHTTGSWMMSGQSYCRGIVGWRVEGGATVTDESSQLTFDTGFQGCAVHFCAGRH